MRYLSELSLAHGSGSRMSCHDPLMRAILREKKTFQKRASRKHLRKAASHAMLEVPEAKLPLVPVGV